MASVLEDNIIPDTFSLRINLDVLASTCIKRKKPWPKLALVGESVFLLDRQRISVLYMETGKTKRKVPKLHGLVSEAVIVTHSSNGEFIGGLLANGNLFLWQKRTDQLIHIPGLTKFATQAPTGHQQALPYIRIADSGFAILLVTASRELFIWEIDSVESFLCSKTKDVSGCWSSVDMNEASFITNNNCYELAVHAVFTLTNSTLGLVCLCSFVYVSGENVRVSTVLLRWFDDQDVYSYRCPKFSADWQTTSFPLSSLGSDVQPVFEKGAFVIRHSRDGQLLAIAINQLNSYCNRLVYVAILPAVITVNDLLGMGTRFPVANNSKSYWVNDMEWTYDDLFLACITGQGSVCIAPRLGAPVLIQTHGCGIDMGPKYFLPLHPLVSIQGQISADDSEDAMRQRFSVAVHPSLQLVLFSDGYMVTAVELSDGGHCFTCLSLTRILAESADARLQHGSYLRHWLQSNFFEKTSDGGSSLARRRGLDNANSINDARTKKKFKFEATPFDAADDAVEADELPPGRGIVNASAGKLVFGDSDNMMKTAEFHGSDLGTNFSGDGDGFVDVSADELMLAWGLMTTHSGVWTVDHEMAAESVVRGLVRVFSAVLDNEKREGLQHVLALYRRFLELASSDCLGQHLHVVLMMFVRRTIDLLLRAKTLRKLSSIGTLHGVSLAIRFAEQQFAQAYSVRVSPSSVRVNALPYASIEVQEVDIYSFPVSFMATEHRKRISSADRHVGEERVRNADLCRSTAARLVTCWKLLYKYAKRYHESMCRHGQESVGKKKKRVSGTKWRHTTSLMSIIAGRLQSLNVDICAQPKATFITGETLYLEGDTDSAICAWLNSIRKMPEGRLDSGVISRVLHSILYAQLQRYRLRDALRLVELVLHLQDMRQVAALYNNADTSQFTIQQLNKWNKKQSYSNQPMSMRTRTAQRLMQSLGRVMAMYFTGRTVFVLPPHHPLLIPALYTERNTAYRVITLNRDLVTEAVRKDHLDALWTPKKALEYLLLSGLLPDAVWYVGQLGDWKAQLIMAATVQYHRESSAKESSSRTTLQLPECLQPKNLARDHILTLIEDCLHSELDDSASVNSMTAFVADKLLISLMSGLDATCILLQRFLKRLLDAVRRLKCFIPDGIHLPAPPIYCLQPVITDEERESFNDDQLAELECRRQVALLVRNIIIVLRASRCAAPVASWFASKLLWAYKRGKKLQKGRGDADTDGYMQTFEQYAAIKSQFTGHESDSAVSTLLVSFRDLCAVVWMLGNRDALSLALKQKASEFHNHLNRVDQSTTSQWTAQCEEALHLAVNLLPFASFMQAERQLHSVVLSLILEMPKTHDTAVMLAELFPDVELMSAETQVKLHEILKDWKGVFVANETSGSRESDANVSQRGHTLALVYHDIACQHQQLFEQRCRAFGTYENEVFAREEASSDSSLMIGSRPFESCLGFIQLLDTFYSISFSHELNSSRQVKQMPLIDAFVSKIRQQELNSGFVCGRKLQRNISIRENPERANALPPPKPSLLENIVHQSLRQQGIKLTGLFRSRSVDCLDESSNAIKSSTLQAEEIDVLAAEPLTYSSAVAVRSNKTKSSPRNYNNNNAGSFRRQSPLRRFGRSTSLVEFDEASCEVSTKDLSSEYLVESILSDVCVKEMKFDGNYVMSERMADWMLSYTSKNLGDWSKTGSSVAALRVRVSPKMLTYALWLLDNTRYVVPHVDDVIVAVATQSTSSSWPHPHHLVEESEPTSAMPTNEGTSASVNSKKKKAKVQKKRKQEANSNKASSLFELKEEEGYGTTEWGTRRFSPERVQSGPSQSTEAVRNNPGNSASSECSVSVSSQLDDEEDNRQFHEALRETLARVSRPATMRLDETNDVQLVVNEQQPPTISSLPMAITNRFNVQSHIQPDAVSLNPPGQDLVGQLQKAVRDEMRRIMEAQHQGILAVLNVLDDGTGGHLPQQMNNSRSHIAVNNSLGVQSDVPVEKHQQRQLSAKARESKLSRDDVPTDVSLSTLPSDSASLEKSNVYPEQMLSSQKLNERSRPIGDLNEGKTLPSVDGSVRFLRLSPAVIQGSSQRHGSQPFSSLIDALKQMNGDLGGNPKSADSFEENPPSKLGQFRLLRFPSAPVVDDFPVKLPRMMPLSQPVPPFIPPVTSVQFMPPVNESPSWSVAPVQRTVPDEYLVRWHQSNEGMSNAPPDGAYDELPFPMLRLVDSNSQRVPFFVPPEHLFNRGGITRDELPQSNLPARESPQLLKLNVESLEAQNNADERQKRRRPARAQRHERRSESAESAISGDTELSVLKHVPSSEKTDVKPSARQLQTQPVQLHSGYALSPGMFDEYLSEEPERGSDMVSYAQLQYQAVMGIQSARKPAVLKKDMSTETNETDLMSNGNRNEQGQQTAASSLLPPDVFMQLRFGDVAADAVQSNKVPSGGRAYLNVADIHADILNELRLSAAPQYQAKTSSLNWNQNQQSTNLGADSAETGLESASESTSIRPDYRPPATSAAVLRTTSAPSPRSNPTTSAAVHNQRSKLMMDNMNAQFAAIAALAEHMDNDFSNTELLIRAIDEIEDTAVPSVRSRSPEKSKPLFWEDNHLPSSRSAASPRRRMDNRETEQLGNEKENQIPEKGTPTAVPVDNLQGQFTFDSAHDESLINPQHWPHGFAAKLLDQAMQATEDGKHLNKNDLKELFKALSPPATLTYETQSRLETDQQEEQRKREIREWMQKRSEERMREYQMKTSDLRAAEKHPYKPMGSAPKQTMRDLEEAEKMRWARKRAMLDLRSQDASRLVYELLSEELPPTPDLDINVSTRKTRRTTVDRKKPSQKLPAAATTWTARTDDSSALYDKYSSILIRADNDDEMAEVTLRERREGRENGERVVERNGQNRQPHRRPFTDLVKMQRPDLLQKNREHVRIIRDLKSKEKLSKNPLDQSGTVNNGNRQNTMDTRSSESVGKQRQRIVKSYVERQKGMKQRRPTSSPSMRTVTLQGSRQSQSSLPRKTLTYAEQLQSLQPKKIYSDTDRTQKKPAPRKWTPKQPKTYAQQLQEYQRSRRHEQLKSRSKPYADPYSQSMDHLSTLSSWSIDDNVRRLLYDNSTSDLMNTHRSASNLDLSDLPTDGDMDNYANAVDIGDLDSVVSGISGVSWSSFLDWNEVDRLVEEND